MFLGITTPLFILDKPTLSFKLAKSLIGMDKLTGKFYLVNEKLKHYKKFYQNI